MDPRTLSEILLYKCVNQLYKCVLFGRLLIGGRRSESDAERHSRRTVKNRGTPAPGWGGGPGASPHQHRLLSASPRRVSSPGARMRWPPSPAARLWGGSRGATGGGRRRLGNRCDHCQAAANTEGLQKNKHGSTCRGAREGARAWGGSVFKRKRRAERASAKAVKPVT